MYVSVVQFQLRTFISRPDTILSLLSIKYPMNYLIHEILIHIAYVSVFVWFGSLRPSQQFFSHVGMGLLIRVLLKGTTQSLHQRYLVSPV